MITNGYIITGGKTYEIIDDTFCPESVFDDYIIVPMVGTIEKTEYEWQN